MADTIATLQAVITADTRGFEDGLSSSQKGLKGFGAAAGVAMSVATKAIDVAIDAAVGLGKATIGSAVEWDKAFKNIEAVTKRSTSTLQKQILNMKSAVAGPMELADAMYDIVGGVADASTHMAILDAANKTAEAGAANLKATTTGLISVMNSYKFSATQAAFASDVLTQVVNKGVGTMDQFVAAISPIAGLAAAAGVKFDDLGAAMAFMTTKGASASQAATQAQGAITALLKPNSQMNDLLKKVNVSTDNATAATGKMVTTTKAGAADLAKYNDELAKTQARISDLSGKNKKSAMDQYNLNKLTGKAAELQSKVADGSQIVKYAQGAGNAQKVTAEWLIKTYGLVGALNKLKDAAGGSSQKMAEALGSVEALRAFVALTGGDFAEFEKDFKGSLSGATEAARQVQLQSVSAQFETFKHTLEGVAIAIGSVVLPALNGIFTFMNKGAEVVGKFGPIIQDGLTKIGGVFQPLLDEINRIVKPISDAFGNIQLAFDKFFEDLFGDTSISAVGKRLSKKLGETITPDKSLQEKIGPAFAGLKDAIAEELGKIDLIGIATGLINAAASFGENLARNILKGVLDLGSRLIAQLQAQFAGVDVLKEAGKLIDSALTFGGKVIDNLLSGLTDIVTKVGDEVGKIDAVDIGAKAGKFLADALAFGGKLIGKLISGLLGIDQQVGTEVGAGLDKVDILTRAGNFLGKVLDLGGQILNKLMAGIASMGASFGAEIRKNLDSIDIVAAAGKLLTDAATNARNLVSQFISGIGALGADFGGKIVANLNSIDVGAAAKGLLDSALTIGTNFITNAVSNIAALGARLGGDLVTNLNSIDVGAAAKTLLDGALKIGKDIIDKAVAGITGLATGLITAITGELDKVIAGIQAKGAEIGAAIASAITGKTVTVSAGGGANKPIPGGVGVGVSGGQRASGGAMNMMPALAGALQGQDQAAGGADMAATLQAQLDGAVQKLQPPAGLGAKLASMFSGADVTASLANLGMTISAALATTFGPDGVVMTALQPFADSWALMFGAGGAISTAATGMQGIVDALVASIVNISGTGTPAILEFQAVSTSAAPTIAGAWQPVVGVFRELLMTLEGIAGAAQRATGAMGAIPGVGGGGGGKGYASGGYTGSGPSGQVAGVVHAGEWVVPQNGALVMRSDGGGSGGRITITGPIYVQGVQNANQMYDQIERVARNRNV